MLLRNVGHALADSTYKAATEVRQEAEFVETRKKSRPCKPINKSNATEYKNATPAMSNRAGRHHRCSEPYLLSRDP